MKIRKTDRYGIKVFNAVKRLLPQLDPDSELPAEGKFKSIIRSKNSHFFIAETDDKEIAGILTLITYDILTGHKVWIEDVVVDKSQRGKGIGRGLMLSAINFARSTGAKSIELTSRSSRIAANRLYQEMGFILRETNVYRYNL